MQENPYQPTSREYPIKRDYRLLVLALFALLWIKIVVFFAVLKPAMKSRYEEFELVLPAFTRLLLNEHSTLAVTTIGIATISLFAYKTRSQPRSWTTSVLWIGSIVLFLALLVGLLLPMYSMIRALS